MSISPDFNKYSLEELLEVREHINKEIHPRRYQEILKMLAEKAPESSVATNKSNKPNDAVDKYSTFALRFWALLIDGILFAGILFLESLVFGFDYDTSNNIFQTINGIQVSIYTIIMHGVYGQTVGKMIMDVKVLNHENEEKIGLAQSLMRESVSLFFNVCMLVLVLTVSFYVNLDDSISESFAIGVMTFFGLVMLWSISEFVTMLFNHKRRALHDFIGKTVVVRI